MAPDELEEIAYVLVDEDVEMNAAESGVALLMVKKGARALSARQREVLVSLCERTREQMEYCARCKRKTFRHSEGLCRVCVHEFGS